MKDQKSRHLSVVQKRSLEASGSIATETLKQIAFQHTVLCQTYMPYRNPGDEVRQWKVQQGRTHLLLKAGEALHPRTGNFHPLGLPYGPKARLILAHIDTQAIKKQTPVLNVESSLTAFVKRLAMDPGGRTIQTVKDQLTRLAAADLRLGIINDQEHAETIKTTIVSGFNLWFPKSLKNRVLWPHEITLSQDYFENLKEHAVPLDERALAALAHSAMALDIYAWLAQRLHRVPRRKPQHISWAALKAQFGIDHSRIDKFKTVFRTALLQILRCYPKAKVKGVNGGLTLRNSPPPVSAHMIVV